MENGPMSIVPDNNGEVGADRQPEAVPIQKQGEEEAAISKADTTFNNDRLVGMPRLLW
jgi:hypothetical protein